MKIKFKTDTIKIIRIDHRGVAGLQVFHKDKKLAPFSLEKGDSLSLYHTINISLFDIFKWWFLDLEIDVSKKEQY